MNNQKLQWLTASLVIVSWLMIIPGSATGAEPRQLSPALAARTATMPKTSPVKKPPSEPISVRSANPAKLALIPGGKPVRVTLTGSGLDQTLSALILKGHTPVRSATADLGPASRGALIVTISAGPAAQPGSCTLHLIADGRSVDIKSGVLAIMIKEGDIKAIASKSPSGRAIRYPEVGHMPGENSSPIPVQPTAPGDRAVKIVPLKSDNVKPSASLSPGTTKGDPEPLDRRKPTPNKPRRLVPISGSVNPGDSGPIDLTPPQTPPEEDDAGSNDNSSDSVPMVRAEAAAPQNLALAQPGSQDDDDEQNCGTMTMPELRQLLLETEETQLITRDSYESYSSRVDSLLRQFSTKSAMDTVPAISDAQITAMAEDVASGADASALMAELKELIKEFPQGDVMAALFYVFKAAIEQFSDDKSYLLNRLQEMNDIAEAMGDYMEDLNDLSNQLADALEEERASEICPEIRLIELALAEAETRFNTRNRQLSAEISRKNTILNRLPSLETELEKMINSSYKEKKGKASIPLR